MTVLGGLTARVVFFSTPASLAVGQAVVSLQADVLDLPLAGAQFDWVVCYSVFPHFSDQARGLAQLANTLKPAGRLVVCHSRSREDINAFHHTVGDVVGGHTLPESPEMACPCQPG